MKIAILSDIHGNIVALEEALKDAQNNNVDKYIIAGDIILDFPFINEVVDVIKKLTPYVIKGNREKYLEEYEKSKNSARWNTMQGITIKENCEQLTEENKEYITGLPEQLSINLEGLKIKVIHGSLEKISGAINFDDKEKLDEVTDKIEEDVLIVGHTHIIARYIEHNGKIIINDGTVGMNRYIEDGQYVILNYENGEISIETRNVKYDKEKLKQLIRKSPIYKNSYAWINLGYCDVVKCKDIRMKFTNEGIERMNVKYKIEETDKSERARYSKFNVIDDDIYMELVKKYEKYFLIDK